MRTKRIPIIYLFLRQDLLGHRDFFDFFLTFRLKVGVNNRLPAEKFVFMCAPVKQEISAI